ncbi:carboxymuconolactone decarboxylase family protein [Dactylosporangium sp. CA-092794]|uniref:carboxymuconolactone decarboxylase family protein n=1 Tax=Dactylosporangium sp. CA-092794 TaxID=3239929 RepID=UPI003D912E7E
MTAVDSPKPLQRVIEQEGDTAAFLPYPPIGDELEHVPMAVRPDVFYYLSRMGFLPNTIKLYLHVPWVAEQLFRLNNAIMRDERNGLSEHLKYRLSIIASRDNDCEYCTAHHVAILKGRWGYAESAVEQILQMEHGQDERERVAVEFVHRASLDPTTVPGELRRRLAELFSPQEVMEIVFVVGFWKMYNTMHSAMAAPLEDPVSQYAGWVHVQPAAEPRDPRP